MHHPLANFLREYVCQKLWKIVESWQSYYHKDCVRFFWATLYVVGLYRVRAGIALKLQKSFPSTTLKQTVWWYSHNKVNLSWCKTSLWLIIGLQIKDQSVVSFSFRITIHTITRMYMYMYVHCKPLLFAFHLINGFQPLQSWHHTSYNSTNSWHVTCEILT